MDCYVLLSSSSSILECDVPPVLRNCDSLQVALIHAYVGGASKRSYILEGDFVERSTFNTSSIGWIGTFSNARHVERAYVNVNDILKDKLKVRILTEQALSVPRVGSALVILHFKKR